LDYKQSNKQAIIPSLLSLFPLSAYQRFENNDHFVNIVILNEGSYRRLSNRCKLPKVDFKRLTGRIIDVDKVLTGM
tara:strand:- start:6143 stop:6370 length:228 start_codon:yes stop_codon:yes gene_type:complete